MKSLKSKAGTDGTAKITLSAKGANLQAPAVPLTTPVRAALLRPDAATCWSSDFGSPTRNESGKFVAKAP